MGKKGEDEMEKTKKLGLSEYVTRFVKRGFIVLLVLSIYNLIYPFVVRPVGYDYSFESLSMMTIVTLVFGLMMLFVLSFITYPIIWGLFKYINKRMKCNK